MTPVRKVFFSVHAMALLAVGIVQGIDATRWALAPWPHFTLREDGYVMTRGLAEAPDGLRPLLARSPLVLRDVRLQPDGAWLPVTRGGGPALGARRSAPKRPAGPARGARDHRPRRGPDGDSVGRAGVGRQGASC